MDANRKKRNQLLAEKVIKGLESRNMVGFYVETKQEALQKAASLIPKGSSVGWGGSASIDEIGLKVVLKTGEYVLYDGVHPSFAGHAVIAEALYEALEPIL